MRARGVLGSMALAGLLIAQAVRTTPQVATFRSDVDDTDQPYALALPHNYDPGKSYPLVISLHAASSNHRLNLRRVLGRGNLPGETEAEASRNVGSLPDSGYIVACPLARGVMGYRGIPEKDVYDVLEDVRRHYRVDEDRVYLTGIDMGGGGAMWLAVTRPDVWAGVAPLCPEPPEGTAELAGNLLNVAVHLFQGELDPLVPTRGTRTWHKALLDLGVKAEYTEYPNLRHNVWDGAYRNLAVFRWFDGKRRDPHPDRVRFATRQYRYNSSYWVRLDRLSSGGLSRIDARFTAANQVEVLTANLDAFTLLLAGHPRVTAGRPVIVKVDGVPLRVRSASEVLFTRQSGTWRAGDGRPQAGEKRPGFAGPIAEVVQGRHAYVYGTLGAASEEELNRRKAAAEKAADWSTARVRLLLSLPTIADHQALGKEYANVPLVLFGTRDTNQVISAESPHLPMALNPSAADYGLLYVYPMGARLALIQSGIPWYTHGGGTAGKRTYVPERYQSLLELGDFVLYRESLEHILVQGRFDSHWQLSTADRDALRASGVVVVNQ